MPRYDFRSTRVYVEGSLGPDTRLPLNSAQTNYLRNVLRLKPGERVLVFNGRDGEWCAALAEAGKRAASLMIEERTRAQTSAPDLHYLFAPLKHARLDYMVQKAVEMGVSRLQPVLTQHGQVARVNLERMRSKTIEAAEQCGILNLPEIAAPLSLDGVIAEHDPARLMVFCDEAADVKDPVEALAAAPQGAEGRGCAVLIGPEGGFSETERATLLKLPNVVRLALGPRILRADTAAVAALALVQGVLGDWR
jgi:16S rRNA (uracil1498-N3)-methyltransferase